MTEEKIAKINELYKKSKNEGLTEEEKELQQQLRKEFIMSVKASLGSQLENISIVEKDGSITKVTKKQNKNN